MQLIMFPGYCKGDSECLIGIGTAQMMKLRKPSVEDILFVSIIFLVCV